LLHKFIIIIIIIIINAFITESTITVFLHHHSIRNAFSASSIFVVCAELTVQADLI